MLINDFVPTRAEIIQTKIPSELIKLRVDKDLCILKEQTVNQRLRILQELTKFFLFSHSFGLIGRISLFANERNLLFEIKIFVRFANFHCNRGSDRMICIVRDRIEN